MPLATKPIVELIVDALMYRLSLLTAGYSVFTAVREVVRPVRLGGEVTPRHLQIVLTQAAPERVEELDLPGNPPALCWRMQFNIRCRVMPSEKDTTPVDAIINTMAADVVKVVCDTAVELEDYRQHAWHTFRGRAILADWLSQEVVESDGSFDGINVPLAITYRVSETNPYALRN